MQTRRIFSTHLSTPIFVELVCNADALTLRTYEEVFAVEAAKLEGDTQGPRPSVYHGAVTDKMYLLPDPTPAAGPVGTQIPLIDQDRERWPVSTPLGAPILIAGENLSPKLRTKTFIELGSSCLDRLHDPHLGPESWTDSAEWVFDINKQGIPVAPYNKSAFTSGKRYKITRFSMLFDRIPILRLFQPFRDIPLDRCSLFLLTNSGLGFKSTPDWEWTDISGRHTDLAALVPGLRWRDGNPKTIKANETVKLHLECVDPVSQERIADSSGHLVIESDSGYVPVRRCPLKNGQAEFIISASLLPAGHTVKIAVGFEDTPPKLSTELKVTDANSSAGVV